jgi:hypothetical protein
MTDPAEPTEPPAPSERPARPARKQVLLRLDPAVHDALARWAADELRSTNAQIDYLLRQAMREAGRLPGDARPPARRGRPPRQSRGLGGESGSRGRGDGAGARDG